MELRAAVGVYDPSAPRYTVYTSAGGGVVRQRDDIAAVLGMPPAAVRGRAMSAEISASATAPVRNSRWLPGRRDGSGAR